MAKAYSSDFDSQYREVAYDAFLCGYGAKCDAPSSKEHVCLDDGVAPSKQKCGDCTIACGAKVEDDRDVIFWKGMQHAIAGMKKDAVEGEVVKDINNKLAVTAKINLDGFKFGEKVRVIVLPKEE